MFFFSIRNFKNGTNRALIGRNITRSVRLCQEQALKQETPGTSCSIDGWHVLSTG